MSRVSDALKRAAAGNNAPAASPLEATATVDGAWMLESYPQEPGAAEPSATHPRVVDGGKNAATKHTPVARASGVSRHGRSSSVAGSKLVGGQWASPLVVEQYRRLAASLHDLQVGHALQVLMVTSALPQEGKTFTVVNLALTLTESYRRRLLLIDADLRRPSVHNVLGIQNTAGLGEALQSSSVDLPISDVTPLLSVMTAGRPMASPLAGLSSPRLREILDACAARYDWVLLDAPPVGLLPDGQLLARTVGAVVLVIRANATAHTNVERAVAELGRDCIVGTVLNGADERDIPAADEYGDYYR